MKRDRLYWNHLKYQYRSDFIMHLSTMIDWRHALLGVVLTLACSLAGQSLASLPGFSLIGHLVLALLLGMAIQVCRPVTLAARESTGFIANKFLRAGIIFLGFKLNLIILVSAGMKSLIAAVFVVAIMIPLNYAVARALRVDHTLALLTACGCSICGAAAVMGVSGTVKAKADQSVMAGLSLHEIAHAVAAGGSAGPIGTDSAIITKLSRVLLLAPVAIILGIGEAWRQRRQSGDTDQKFKIPIPWFMGGFIAASAIGSYIPAIGFAVPMLIKAAYLILGMAMAALGLNVNFAVIAKEGIRPMGGALVCSFVLLGLAWFIVRTWF